MYAITKRNFWREFKLSRRGNRPRLSCGLMLFEEGFTLDLFGLFIPLLFLDRWHYEPVGPMELWGFGWFGRSIHLNWGDSCKVIDLPWSYVLVSHEVARADGSWGEYVGSYEKDKKPDGRENFVFDYTYNLENGIAQHRKATVYMERWDRRWRRLRWTKLFRVVSQSISFTFDGEVGESSGSWKGGCISSGETMLPGESIEQTFRRMERERKF